MKINDFDVYQVEAMAFARCPDLGKGVYPALGLAGEAGELCDKIKKIYRDDAGSITPEAVREIVKEAGDTLWYLARLGVELGFTLSDVAETNLHKLQDRAIRGRIGGSGDNR